MRGKLIERLSNNYYEAERPHKWTVRGHMKLATLVLDHKEGISIDMNAPPIPNPHALNYLPSGLNVLATSMRVEENRVIEWNRTKYDISPEQLFNSISMMGIVGADNPLCICLFHWFSVSLTNYLRLVALVDYYQTNKISQSDIKTKKQREHVKKYCDEYSMRVCPHILRWRNKIGAHMAITSPFESDSQGTLEMSTMNSISHEKLRVFTGSFTWVGNGQSADLPKWSLTEEYESLTERLWPQYSIPELNL
jgi:hypothetical protein